LLADGEWFDSISSGFDGGVVGEKLGEVVVQFLEGAFTPLVLHGGLEGVEALSD
jgi:hypothetical protein